jgi:RNA polymerase sigma factor (sigma-70 family)
MRETRPHSGDPGEIWPDDAALQPVVHMAQQGEPSAVNALLARLRPVLVEFFARELDRDTAEDLVQDTLLRVVGALPRLDPARGSRYVTRVAHRRLQSEFKRRARDSQRFVPMDAAREMPSPITADQEAEYADLVRALTKLSPRVRACVMEALHGSRSVETAVSHGVSPVTVRVQLKIARARLRSALGLAAKERYPSLTANNGSAPRVREGTACRAYPSKRFPESRSRGSGGARSRLRRVRVHGGFAYHASRDGARALGAGEGGTGSRECAKLLSHSKVENASGR